MYYGLILDVVLATAYMVICVASLAVRSKIIGSVLASRFLAIGIASAIGLVTTLIELLRNELGLLRTWIPQGMVTQVLPILSLHVPLIIMALALTSIAHLYSHYEEY